MKQTAIIIPARYGSSRLEGKPLLRANNKPIIQWVWEKASKCPLVDRVIIATDDERIFNVCKDFGAEVEMTSRSKIPYERNAGKSKIYGHLGIYGYKREALFKMTKLPQTSYEQAESLEQLRALQNGMKIKVAVVDNIPVGIDTLEDFEKFKRMVEG